jgi:hypothetical protein
VTKNRKSSFAAGDGGGDGRIPVAVVAGRGGYDNRHHKRRQAALLLSDFLYSFEYF